MDKKYNKNIFQWIKDLIGLPIRVIFPDFSSKIRLTSLHEERWQISKFYSKGIILDIGCGNNDFLRRFKLKGYGIDTCNLEGIDVVAEGSKLPFKNNVFDTVCFIASLNHIPKRIEALEEAKRILKDDGIVLITMLNPIVGWLNHKLLFWLSKDNYRRREIGEKDGLWTKEIIEIFKKTGFKLKLHQKFFYSLNNFYLFEKNHDEYLH